MPCSYCSFVGASPTEAKCPFIAMSGGAVWCLEAAVGRWPFVFRCAFVADDIVAGLGAIVQEWLMNVFARDLESGGARTTGISSPVEFDSGAGCRTRLTLR
jgi:hypothetical protein